MNRPLSIIAAVTGYSAGEFLLLWCLTLPVLQPPGGSGRSLLLLLLQCLTIPGLASLFLFLVYGTEQWRRRLGMTLLLTFAALWVGGMTVGFAAAAAAFLQLTAQDLFGESAATTLAVLFFACVVVFAAIVPFRSLRARSVQLEKLHWQSERALDVGERRRRNTAVRLAAWIPLCLVGLTFLFLPEFWGLFSHLAHPRGVHLSGYRVQVPASWIITPYPASSKEGWSYIGGYAGRGPMFSGFPDFDNELASLSHWEIGTTVFSAGHGPSQYLTRDPGVVSERAISIANGKLTCVQHRLEWRSGIWVQCASTDRLYANFIGNQAHLDGFYRMLKGIKPEPIPTEQLFAPPRLPAR